MDLPFTRVGSKGLSQLMTTPRQQHAGQAPNPHTQGIAGCSLLECMDVYAVGLWGRVQVAKGFRSPH